MDLWSEMTAAWPTPKILHLAKKTKMQTDSKESNNEAHDGCGNKSR